MPPAPGGGIPPPPTPCTGAAPSPTGGARLEGLVGGGTPRPAPRATPGPPGVNTPIAEGGGGPSTAKLTTFSPRKSTRPRLRFSVRSSKIADPPLLLSVRNSSASDKTRFRCLSNAKNVPTIARPSCSVTRKRCSTYRNSLLPLLFGILLNQPATQEQKAYAGMGCKESVARVAGLLGPRSLH
mmetsp:Transcript_7051/g.14453  ORF Transcript_7051/g.14453 Transcript_7051/m.14453 type:complete len:183 (-) Transcript_7051:31-579(-)